MSTCKKCGYEECYEMSTDVWQDLKKNLTKLMLLGNRRATLTGDPSIDDLIKRKLEQDITAQFTLGLTIPNKQRILSGNPQSLNDAILIV